MDKEDWLRLNDIFDTVREQDHSYRRDYIDMICEDNPGLRQEVETMLAAYDNMPATFGDSIFNQEIVIPDRMGEFKIGELLGSGGMSRVCRATHPKYGEVAIKIVSHQVFFYPETQARFDREVEILRNLNHPSMCRIYEVVKSDRVSAIAMQLLDGENLEKILMQGIVPVNRAIEIALDIADLLALAHDNGIVHRDIKPSNVIIVSTGNTYVIDFGIAKVLDAKLTRTGQMLGSPQYMAPEQWRGQPADFRSDIWSLGVLLYHMCIGEIPFDGDSHAAIAKNILAENAVLGNHGKLEKLTSPKLQLIIERMLRKDPAERQQSMAQIRDELRSAMPS